LKIILLDYQNNYYVQASRIFKFFVLFIMLRCFVIIFWSNIIIFRSVYIAKFLDISIKSFFLCMKNFLSNSDILDIKYHFSCHKIMIILLIRWRHCLFKNFNFTFVLNHFIQCESFLKSKTFIPRLFVVERIARFLQCALDEYQTAGQRSDPLKTSLFSTPSLWAAKSTAYKESTL